MQTEQTHTAARAPLSAQTLPSCTGCVKFDFVFRKTYFSHKYIGLRLRATRKSLPRREDFFLLRIAYALTDVRTTLVMVAEQEL